MFYTREEQPARYEPATAFWDSTDSHRQSAWFFGNCIANLISGVVVYGIGNIEIHTIAQWQLIFLILGAFTASLSFWLAFLLPDNPMKARFLSRTERTIAVQRTLKNKTGVMDNETFKWDQAFMAIKDPQTWFLVLYTFCVNLCNGGITTVGSPEATGPCHFADSVSFPRLSSTALGSPSSDHS